MSRKERNGQVQQFDALYVVSDLHIGGPADGQIFRQSELLTSLIRTLGSVSENSPTRSGADVWNSVAISDQSRYAALPGTDLRVGLVLNGDVVDFLAEPSPVYLDIDNGKNKLEGIVNREPFKDVFVALREYLGQENRFLVLVLGNHDVELALPGPQQWLREWLAGGDDAARGRLILATDGSGFRCQVGTSDVLCIHGEIADDWNRIDHQGLRAIAHGWKAGRSSYDWTPNGGTRLVIDVMNEVKETYAFVDLLKPEIEAVLPILNALDAKTAGRAFCAARAYAFKVEHGMIRSRFLSDDGQRIEADPEDLFACAAMQILGADQDDGLSALEQAEKDVRDGADPVELARADSLEDEMLSWWRVAASTPGSLYNRLRVRATSRESV